MLLDVTMQKLFKSGRVTVAICIAIFTFAILLLTAKDIGLTWDEPAYMAASESYMNWYEEVFNSSSEAFTEKEITSAWQVNNEHPPLDKIWSGAVWSIAHHLTDDLTAHRMGNMILVSILAGMLYLLIYDAYGGVAGLAAVAALLSMPRFFFHAHLAALDIPAAFSVFVVTFAFWKLFDRKHWTWGLLLGLLWGMALATKINAVFLPIALIIWVLIFRREMRAFLRLIIMGLAAIPVFIAVWPWLYINTIEHFAGYIKFFTTEHWLIGQYYLGQFYMPPPWHFGFVMIWAVLPLGITLLYLAGIVSSGKGKKDGGLGGLLFISAIIPVLAISSGKILVFDNERLIMPAFPFLAALAGIGFNWSIKVITQLGERWRKPAVRIAGISILIGAASLPQLVTMIRLYPHYLSYYGEGVGGLTGATRLGLETTYWCETYRLALPIINRQAEKGDRLWADPWSHYVLVYYQKHGMLRNDLVILSPMQTESIMADTVHQTLASSMQKADWFIYQYRQTTLRKKPENSEFLLTLQNKQMVYEYKFDDVPIFKLYHEMLKTNNGVLK
jgi:4-amino-4-deoxy-L-arabinose transferase-like glycosyltransferase